MNNDKLTDNPFLDIKQIYSYIKRKHVEKENQTTTLFFDRMIVKRKGIERFELKNKPNFNFIYGEHGSGKTIFSNLINWLIFGDFKEKMIQSTINSLLYDDLEFVSITLLINNCIINLKWDREIGFKQRYFQIKSSKEKILKIDKFHDFLIDQLGFTNEFDAFRSSIRKSFQNLRYIIFFDSESSTLLNRKFKEKELLELLLFLNFNTLDLVKSRLRKEIFNNNQLSYLKIKYESLPAADIERRNKDISRAINYIDDEQKNQKEILLENLLFKVNDLIFEYDLFNFKLKKINILKDYNILSYGEKYFYSLLIHFVLCSNQRIRLPLVIDSVPILDYSNFEKLLKLMFSSNMQIILLTSEKTNLYIPDNNISLFLQPYSNLEKIVMDYFIAKEYQIFDQRKIAVGSQTRTFDYSMESKSHTIVLEVKKKSFNFDIYYQDQVKLILKKSKIDFYFILFDNRSSLKVIKVDYSAEDGYSELDLHYSESEKEITRKITSFLRRG